LGTTITSSEEEKTLYFSLIGERPPAELAIGENPKLIPASETLAAAESEFATNMLFTYYRMSSNRLLKNSIYDAR
jgi:hypothetical protein